MHDRGAIHRKLLLAEDCPTDIQVFKRALRRSNCGARYELQVLIDGAETLDFLFKRGRWSDAWTPDVLVLNINMPKCNGWDVLRRMKSDPGLRGIPTVIWTIVSIEEYDARTYDWGACGIFTKPVDTAEMERQVEAILIRSSSIPGPPTFTPISGSRGR